MKMRDRRRCRQPSKRQIAMKRMRRILGRPLEDAIYEMASGAATAREALQRVGEYTARYLLRQILRDALPGMIKAAE
jgi:hypothetical protein